MIKSQCFSGPVSWAVTFATGTAFYFLLPHSPFLGAVSLSYFLKDLIPVDLFILFPLRWDGRLALRPAFIKLSQSIFPWKGSGSISQLSPLLSCQSHWEAFLSSSLWEVVPGGNVHWGIGVQEFHTLLLYTQFPAIHQNYRFSVLISW